MGVQIFLIELNPHLKEEYRAVNFVKKTNDFPISLEKSKLDRIYDESDEKKLGFDPNAINLKLIELCRYVHGSLDPKPKIIEDFNEQYPECSKNSIERKLKECFVKDKRDEDPRHRYYASDELINQLSESFPNGKDN